jgi:hypothetical protein
LTLRRKHRDAGQHAVPGTREALGDRLVEADGVGEGIWDNEHVRARGRGGELPVGLLGQLRRVATPGEERDARDEREPAVCVCSRVYETRERAPFVGFPTAPSRPWFTLQLGR